MTHAIWATAAAQPGASCYRGPEQPTAGCQAQANPAPWQPPPSLPSSAAPPPPPPEPLPAPAHSWPQPPTAGAPRCPAAVQWAWIQKYGGEPANSHSLRQLVRLADLQHCSSAAHVWRAAVRWRVQENLHCSRSSTLGPAGLYLHALLQQLQGVLLQLKLLAQPAAQQGDWAWRMVGHLPDRRGSTAHLNTAQSLASMLLCRPHSSFHLEPSSAPLPHFLYCCAAAAMAWSDACAWLKAACAAASPSSACASSCSRACRVRAWLGGRVAT